MYKVKLTTLKAVNYSDLRDEILSFIVLYLFSYFNTVKSSVNHYNRIKKKFNYKYTVLQDCSVGAWLIALLHTLLVDLSNWQYFIILTLNWKLNLRTV